MKIIYLLLLSAILLVTSISAEETYGTYQMNQPINLIQTCATCTYVNITSVMNPNSNIILQNVVMDKTGALFNYTMPSQSILGQYIICGYGDVDGEATDWCYTFNVTVSGKENTNWLPLIITVVFLTVLFLVLMLWAKDSMPFLAHFFFMMVIWMIVIISNFSWRFAFEYGLTLQSFLLAFYRIMLIISALITFIMLVMMTIDAVQIRKVKGNPIDSYHDNLDKNDKKDMF